MSTALVLQAWTELLYVDLVGLFGFRMIRRIVGHVPMTHAVEPERAVAAIVRAVAAAKLLYIKPVFCLQHCAVVTRLARRRGIPAELVIGCHMAPLRAHAWVEVAGEVVDQRLEGMEFFCILDRW